MFACVCLWVCVCVWVFVCACVCVCVFLIDLFIQVSQIVLTDEPVNNTLLLESVKLFNEAVGTNLEVK